MKVQITNPKTVVVVQEQTKTITELTIKRMVDLPSQKKVIVFTAELNEPIVLWEGESYDAIGDWTNDDVNKKLAEIYGR